MQSTGPNFKNLVQNSLSFSFATSLHSNSAKMSVESEILSLLTALLQVSPGMLQAHRTEIIPVLETLAERVGVTVIQNPFSASYQQTAPPLQYPTPDPLAPQSTAYEESSSISFVRSTQQTSADVIAVAEVDSIDSPASLQQTSGELDTIDDSSLSVNNEPLENLFRPQQFLDKIQENLEKIVKFSTNNSSNIIKSVLAVEDDRLRDIKSIIGKKKPTPNNRYVQCLAQRSLALEYNQWDLKRGGTRLDDVFKNAPSAKIKKRGNFTYYVQRVRRFNDFQTAYKALKRGVRQLIIEEKCDFSGIEVVIPFTYQYFDALSYDDLHMFGILLQQKMDILGTLKQASSWVENSQSIYDGYRKDKRPRLELESSLPRTKRPRWAGPIDIQNPESSSAHYSSSTPYASERSLARLNTNNATSMTEECAARHNIPTTDETFVHALNTIPLPRDNRSFPPQYGMGDAWADTRECFMSMQLPQYGFPDASAGGYSLADSQIPQYGIPDASAGILSLPHPMNSHRQELALITDTQIPQYGISNASAGGTTTV
ncbi:hypothetical protein RJ035_001505 [Blastomyces gilchristii]